jgi:formyltetrahydrofolate deformylase
VTRSLAETWNSVVARNSFDDRATASFSIRVEFRPLNGEESLAQFIAWCAQKAPPVSTCNGS